MITLRKYQDLAQAGYAQSLLQSRGIEAFLHGEYAYQTEGWDGVRLQVPEADVEAALRILDGHEDAIPLPDDFQVPPLQPGQEPGEAPVVEC